MQNDMSACSGRHFLGHREIGRASDGMVARTCPTRGNFMAPRISRALAHPFGFFCSVLWPVLMLVLSRSMVPALLTAGWRRTRLLTLALRHPRHIYQLLIASDSSRRRPGAKLNVRRPSNPEAMRPLRLIASRCRAFGNIQQRAEFRKPNHERLTSRNKSAEDKCGVTPWTRSMQ